ncbi:MAG TPA: ammonium transporter [Elusimicrobiota bacterium]|nr:ammonium transporter [Elusimicrobiota bacterium]
MSRIKLCLGGCLFLTLLVWGLIRPVPVASAEEPVIASAAVAAPVPSPTLEERLGEITKTLSDRKVASDTLWVLITAMLVFWMNAGFALVESGFCRAKNAVNILSKNFIVFAVSSIAFYALGWGLMFGDGNGFLGLKGLFFLGGADNSPATAEAYQGVYSALNWTGVPLAAKFFFQLVFAGTAATIVSGCVAERIKYVSFIAFSFLLVAFIYPVTGHWIWGGGWLAKLGFWDFAGSTAVHTVGGVAGLAGILLLGPRLGKYRADHSVNAIPGHNMTSATLGTLILWLGWFGFNPGSTMAADPASISHIINTTNMAGAAGLLSATLLAWILLGKPDLGMTINGCLAGFVAITAPCAFVSLPSSLIIGALAGVLVVYAVLFFDRLRIDDPVGALAVHLCNGVFGTLAVGLFAQDKITGVSTGNGLFYGGGFKLLGIQALGSLSVIAFTFVLALLFWGLIKIVLGMRVTRDEEIRGLDIDEHGMEAYAGFQTWLTDFGIATPVGGNDNPAPEKVPAERR